MEQEFIERFDKLDERFGKLEGMVEDLAAATARGFAAVEKRFEEVDEKFEKMEQRIAIGLADVEERLSSKIEGIQRSVDANYERQSALETRVTKVETTLHL